jgi:hypothetical protein
LHSDDNSEIYDRAAEIIMNYWRVEELDKHDHNLHNSVSGSVHSFSQNLTSGSFLIYYLEKITPWLATFVNKLCFHVIPS